MKNLLPGLSILSLALAAQAQTPGASQQVDAWRFQQNLPTAGVSTNAAPELYPGETSDVGPQSLLQLQPHRRWVEANAEVQLFYTDNVFLSDHQKQSANVVVSTVEAALAPTQIQVGDGQLAPRLGYQHSWFNYGLLGSDQVLVAGFNPITLSSNRLSKFDFNVQTIFADTSWSKGGWDYSVGLDFRRFLDSGSYNEFYRELVPRIGVHRTFQLSDSQSIMVGYEGDYRFTRTQNPVPANNASYNDRTDQSLILVATWRLCQHCFLQPYYRLQYSYFINNNPGRQDWENTAGLVVGIPLTQNLVLRTYATYDTLATDGHFVASYDRVDLGGGLNLSLRF
ncbi:MAG TPA: hypothetical protein VF607_15035 [Verrucomicrobiae bacterium]